MGTARPSTKGVPRAKRMWALSKTAHSKSRKALKKKKPVNRVDSWMHTWPSYLLIWLLSNATNGMIVETCLALWRGIHMASPGWPNSQPCVATPGRAIWPLCTQSLTMYKNGFWERERERVHLVNSNLSLQQDLSPALQISIGEDENPPEKTVVAGRRRRRCHLLLRSNTTSKLQNTNTNPISFWPENPNSALTFPKSIWNDQIDTQNKMNKLKPQPNDTQRNQTKP